MKSLMTVLAAAVMMLAPLKLVAMEGLWKLTWKGPFGYTYEELEIRKVGETYLGRLATRNLTDLVIDGNELSFSVDAVVPIGKIQMQFSGARDGDALSGTLNIVAPVQIPPNTWRSVRYSD